MTTQEKIAFLLKSDKNTTSRGHGTIPWLPHPDQGAEKLVTLAVEVLRHRELSDCDLSDCFETLNCAVHHEFVVLIQAARRVSRGGVEPLSDPGGVEAWYATKMFQERLAGRLAEGVVYAKHDRWAHRRVPILTTLAEFDAGAVAWLHLARVPPLAGEPHLFRAPDGPSCHLAEKARTVITDAWGWVCGQGEQKKYGGKQFRPHGVTWWVELDPVYKNPEIEGKSLGVAAAVAMIALFQGVPLLPDCAVSGELSLDPDGTVEVVDGVEQKARAWMACLGHRRGTVLYRAEDRPSVEGVAFVSITTVAEAYGRMTGDFLNEFKEYLAGLAESKPVPREIWREAPATNALAGNRSDSQGHGRTRVSDPRLEKLGMRVLLRGEIGRGVTTLLRGYAGGLASDAAGALDNYEPLDESAHHYPALILAPEWEPELARDERPDECYRAAFLRAAFSRLEPAIAEFFVERCDHNNVVVFVDGLDETPHGRRLAVVNALLADVTHGQVMLASRAPEDRPLDPECRYGVDTVYWLGPLTAREQDDICASNREVWVTLRRIPATVRLWWSPDLVVRANLLLGEGGLTAHAATTDVYEKLIQSFRLLGDRWDSLLDEIGWAIVTHGTKLTAGENVVLDAIKRADRLPPEADTKADVLDRLLRARLLKSTAGGLLFAEPTFAEYLAGRRLAQAINLGSWGTTVEYHGEDVPAEKVADLLSRTHSGGPAVAFLAAQVKHPAPLFRLLTHRPTDDLLRHRLAAAALGLAFRAGRPAELDDSVWWVARELLGECAAHTGRSTDAVAGHLFDALGRLAAAHPDVAKAVREVVKDGCEREAEAAARVLVGTWPHNTDDILTLLAHPNDNVYQVAVRWIPEACAAQSEAEAELRNILNPLMSGSDPRAEYARKAVKRIDSRRDTTDNKPASDPPSHVRVPPDSAMVDELKRQAESRRSDQLTPDVGRLRQLLKNQALPNWEHCALVARCYRACEFEKNPTLREAVVAVIAAWDRAGYRLYPADGFSLRAVLTDRRT